MIGRRNQQRIGTPAAMTFSLILLISCAGEVEPRILAGIDSCEYCGMIIDQVNQACGYDLEGQFVTFDSPVCLLYSLESLEDGDGPLPTSIWFADYRDGTFHLSTVATFLLTDHIPTVMDLGVISFSDQEAAEIVVAHDDEIVTDWLGFRTREGTPDVVVDLRFGSEGMEPETVEVKKDELVLFRGVGRGLEGDLTLSFRGYPEFGTVVIPGDGTTIEFRLMAIRPGAGFPIISGDGESLGMLKVEGPHISEEAER